MGIALENLVRDPWAPIAEGDSTNIGNLGAHESRFAEGDRGILQLDLKYIPPGTDTILKGIDASLKAVGVNLWKSSEILDGRRVRIFFQKGLGPLAIIAAVVVASVLLLLLVKWQILKIDPKTWIPIILAVVAILFLVFLLLALWGKAQSILVNTAGGTG